MSHPALAALVLLLGTHAGAAGIFDGDPVDPATGRPYVILPGLPLVLPQPDSGRYRPPIVDPTRTGDVDIVVRAGTLGIGPLMPPPVATPPIAIAGGVRVAPGTEIPFTVIASTGGAGVGTPLGGTSLDGMPVVVAAFADLDGDGIVGPTAADPDGVTDDVREVQEAAFLVGRQVAVFSGGVAEGTLAVWKGAPASAGGLDVVLTAVAYVGPFDPTHFDGGVPDGPAVATRLPAFLDPNPDRTIDGSGPAGPGDRIGFVFEPAFDLPVADPALAGLFALPTDGSSPTIDRAVVVSGPVSAARFLAPALGAYSSEVEAGLLVGAGGALLLPQTSASVVDDGAGSATTVRLVPLDRLGNPTDAAPGTTATLLAGPGLAIATPDDDGDPARETVPLGAAGGVDVTLDEAGGANDSGATSRLDVLLDGVPVDRLMVAFTPGSGGGPLPPVVRGTVVLGEPAALVRTCPARKTLAAVVDPRTGGPATVTATLAIGGTTLATLALRPATLPAGTPLPAGPGFTGDFMLKDPPAGVLAVTVGATNAAGAAVPATLALPLVDAMPPTVLEPALEPATVPAGVRTAVTATARVFDDCGVRTVQAQMDLGRGFRRAGRLRDNGRRGDAVAGDGVFTGVLRVRPRQRAAVPVRLVARNAARLNGTSPTTLLVVP